MSAYKAAIDKVKNAVAEADTVTPQAVYIVEGGYVKASDSRMTAGAPWPDPDHKFVVPAEPFEKALRLMEAPKIELTEKGVIVKEGRRRVTIPVFLGENVVHFSPEGSFYDIPGGFKDALVTLEPFMSDNKLQAWACGVLFSGEQAIATNNVVVARATLEDNIEQDDFLVPDWAVRFIIKSKATIVSYSVTRSALCFKLEDGSWLRSAKMAQLPPQSLHTILDRISEAEFFLTDTWKAAYDFAVSFADDAVTITPTEIIGGKLDRADARADAVTAGVETEAVYHPKYLSKVLTRATHFDPGAWPLPAPFKGPGLTGLIIGRK